jgi:hypothetical protein
MTFTVNLHTSSWDDCVFWAYSVRTQVTFWLQFEGCVLPLVFEARGPRVCFNPNYNSHRAGPGRRQMLVGLGRYQVGHHKKHPTQNHLEMERLCTRSHHWGDSTMRSYTGLAGENRKGPCMLGNTDPCRRMCTCARKHTHTQARFKEARQFCFYKKCGMDVKHLWIF